MTSRTLASILFLLLLAMAVPQRASAYIDPGSGSMIWQLAAAAVFGALFQIKRIAGWFRSRRKPEDARQP